MWLSWHGFDCINATDLDIAKLAAITQEIGISQAIEVAEGLLKGTLRGRVVVDVNRR